MEPDHPPVKARKYLTLTQIAKQLGISPRTVVRYRSEYAPYLNPYAPPGGGRGLRPEAVEILRTIHTLKSHRAHWTEVKRELDARFGVGEAPAARAGTRSFQRSLEAIRDSNLLLTSELRLLFRDVNRRLEALEDTVKQLQALLPLPQRLAEERSRRELAISHARRLIEEQQRQIQQLKGEIPRTEPLFPETAEAELEEQEP
ncbi:MAG: MerR family transcriptional regulator [Candidatus Zixiibacteriota bacterium]|nr:MAG: MerR family transcriptional regulator [candidate division Zixibacteria bacterium]